MSLRRLGKNPRKRSSRDVREGLCVCWGGWLEEITHRERGSVRNSGAGLLGHGHSLFSLNVFTLLQWQLHFKQSLKLYLGFGGKPKRRVWVPSLDHAEQKENKSRGGEPRWARAKPSCANQEPEVIRKAKTWECSNHGEGIPLPAGQQEGAWVHFI